MNVWTEHRNPEGRTYWFNTNTSQSVWEKPDDLKTAFEKALSQTVWKEYFSGGRKYYYNTETKESKWDMPEELTQLMNSVNETGSSTPAAPGAIAAAPPAQNAVALVDPSQLGMGLGGGIAGLPLPLPAPAGGALPSRPNLPEDPVIPHNGFATIEEGERAFTHLLRKAGVDPGWTWEQTMRTIITDPLYKALNTLSEKKTAWQKYIDDLRSKDAAEKEARLAKFRPMLRNMLKGNPSVFPYTTFATADKVFAQHPIWQQAKFEPERKMIFEEYVGELKQQEIEQQRAAHGRAISKVVSLFKDLQIDVLTKWRDAHRRLLESPEYRADKELQELPNLDILLAFEDFSRAQEREFEEQLRRTQVDKARRERTARENFRALLAELVSKGALRARRKWKQVYPEFADDERYLGLLGMPGSNPLELFWDVVDGLDQRLDAKIAVVAAAIKVHDDAAKARGEVKAAEEGEEPRGFVVGADTTLEELLAVLGDDQGVKAMDRKDVEEVFYALREDAVQKHEEERRRVDRKQRHLQDDLRYALKKLPEPLDLNAAFEDAVPAMEKLAEWQPLDDEGRRSAFSKFVKRQKERMREASEDGGSVTSRRRKEPIRDERDRDRDYDRDRGGSRDRRDRGDRRHDYRRDDDYDRRGGDKEQDHKRGKGRDDRRVERRDSRSKWASPRDDTPKKRDPPPHEGMDERAEKRPKREDREDTPEEGEI